MKKTNSKRKRIRVIDGKDNDDACTPTEPAEIKQEENPNTSVERVKHEDLHTPLFKR
jgi:hypothetical protein